MMIFSLYPLGTDNSLSLREQRLLHKEAHGGHEAHPEAAPAAPKAVGEHAKPAADAHPAPAAAPAPKPDAKPAAKEAHDAHAEDTHEKTHAAPKEDLPSVYDTTRNKLRTVLGKTAKVAAFAGLPFFTIPAWLGDKIAMNTVAKIPIIGSAYTKPRELITSTADKALGVTSDLFAAPTLAVDLGEKVLDVLHGKEADAADGLLGKLMHKTTDVIKEVVGIGWKGTKFTYETGKNILKSVFVDSGIFPLLRDLPKIVITAYTDALKNHPKSTIACSIVAASIIASGGTTAAGGMILNATIKVVEGFGTLMQGIGHYFGA